jgi:two-component system response regulator DevR
VASGGSVLDPVVTTRAMAWLKGQASPSSSQPRALSPQQQRVLALLAEGKTNKEIANELGLSEKTVKNYLASLFEKLGVTRRSQAVAFFLRR